MINKEDLKNIIVSNEKFILNEIKKIIERENISFPLKLKKVCILYGVRRSGKTYILYDLFKKYKEGVLYVDFEDERLQEFAGGDFERLKESFFELKPRLISSKTRVFLFDEIQNVEGWEKFARRMAERENIKVFAAGSSSRVMPRQIHTSLRGRSWSIEVLPFSFREYARANNIERGNKEFIYGPQKALVKNYFSSYLRWGGFPEVVSLTSEYERRKTLKEYLDAMFFKDLVERFSIKNISLLDALREKLFSSFSLKYSLSSFCRQYKDKFPFSKDSVFSYFRYFLESMLIFDVKKLAESSYKRLRNPAKIYLADTGLARSVTSSDSGRLLENVVFLELRRKGYEIFYFTDKRECDFVVRTEKGWRAYQVTLEIRDENKSREINGLIEACKFLGIKKGTILTYDEEGRKSLEGINIRIIPVWKWLLVEGENFTNHVERQM